MALLLLRNRALKDVYVLNKTTWLRFDIDSFDAFGLAHLIHQLQSPSYVDGRRLWNIFMSFFNVERLGSLAEYSVEKVKPNFTRYLG